jgi:hypothetical protein
VTKRQLELLKTLPDVTDAMRAYVEEAKEFHSVMLQMPGVAQYAAPSVPTHEYLAQRDAESRGAAAQQVLQCSPQQVTQYAPAPTMPPVAPGSAVLDTPERREYLAQRDAESRGAAAQQELPHLRAARDARKAFLITMRPERLALMEQFKKTSNGATGPEKHVETSTSEELPNMPIATDENE